MHHRAVYANGLMTFTSRATAQRPGRGAGNAISTSDAAQSAIRAAARRASSGSNAYHIATTPNERTNAVASASSATRPWPTSTTIAHRGDAD